MGYSIFEKKAVRIGTPAVSILNNARISLNAPATQIFHKNAVECVLLLWDNENHKLALRPITKKDARAYKLTYQQKMSGASFSAKSFLDYISYDYTEKHAFPASWNEEDQLLEVALPANMLNTKNQPRLLPVENTRKMAVKA